MKPRALLLALLLCLVLVVPASADAPASFDAGGVYVYVPSDIETRSEPAQVVVALHGMGGEGKGFCQGFLRAADRNGWVVVAPTFSYRNWKDPATVAEDDVALTASLARLLDEMPQRLGVPTTGRAVLVGFSRGAQLAHRFALAYPERTQAVAALSAGTYTVPTDRLPGLASAAPLRFPFGTADLAKLTSRDIDSSKLRGVRFWVAVGADDDHAEDVPRQWDALIGTTRVQRAQAFSRALTSVGAPTELELFKGVGHIMSPEMVRGATGFIERSTARPLTLPRRAGVFAF